MAKVYPIQAPCIDEECFNFSPNCTIAGECPKYQKWLLNLKKYNSYHRSGYSNQNGYKIPNGQVK